MILILSKINRNIEVNTWLFSYDDGTTIPWLGS
jgi:hypothetical protein